VGFQFSFLSFDGANMDKGRMAPAQEQGLRAQGLRKTGAGPGHEAARQLHRPDDFIGRAPLFHIPQTDWQQSKRGQQAP